MLTDQNELFIKNNEMYNITRNLLKFIIETYVDKPMDVWINEEGTKEKISKIGISGKERLSYELSEYFILEKEEVEEILEPTICHKIFTDFVLKDYFSNSQNKRKEIKNKIEELKLYRDKIRRSIDNSDDTDDTDDTDSNMENIFDQFFDNEVFKTNNELANDQYDINEDDQYDDEEDFYDDYNENEQEDISTKFKKIDDQIKILELELKTLTAERKEKIINIIQKIIRHRNLCYAHRQDKVDIIELGEWADSLTEYIRYDYEIYIVKGNAKTLDEFKKKIKRYRDALTGEVSVSYFFKGVDYENTDRLIEAFANNWDDGILCIRAENDLKEFMRKQSDLIYSKYREASAPFVYMANKKNRLIADQLLTNGCKNEIQIQKKFNRMYQVYMFRFIYTMNPKINKIFWQGVAYEKDEFVDLFFMPVVLKTKKINAKRTLENSILYTFAKYNLFSYYFHITRSDDELALEAAQTCEKSIVRFVEGNYEEQNLSEFYNQIYGLASYISDSSTFMFMHEKDHYAPHKCDEVVDVIKQIDEYLNGETEFDKLYRIVTRNITPSFRGWLKHKNNDRIDQYFNLYMHYRKARTMQEESSNLYQLINRYIDDRVLLNEDEYKFWVVNGFFVVLLGENPVNISSITGYACKNIIRLYNQQVEKVNKNHKEILEGMLRYGDMNNQFSSLLNDSILSYYNGVELYHNYMNTSKLLCEQLCGIDTYMVSSYHFIANKIKALQLSSLKYCLTDPFLKKFSQILTEVETSLDELAVTYRNKIENHMDDYICYRYKDSLDKKFKALKIDLAAERVKLISIKKERYKSYLYIVIALVVLMLLLKIFI